MGLSRACLSSGREQRMGASITKGFKSERDTQRRAERERERQKESWGSRERERGGEAAFKVPQGLLQNSTVLMLRYSESDRAVLLDKNSL